MPVTDLKGSEGTITMPINGASLYTSNQYCIWIIDVSYGYGVSINFLNIDLEGDLQFCSNDYITIIDLNENTPIHQDRLCGTSNPGSLLSWSNRVKVVFRSNEILARSGFSLTYSAAIPSTVACLARTILYDDYGYIRVPSRYYNEYNYYNYENNMRCEWIIQASSCRRVFLEIYIYDIEGPSPSCPFDYLEITDLGSNHTGHQYRLCGKSASHYVNSTTDRVLVVLNSDDSVTRTGFILYYSTYMPVTEGGPDDHCSTSSDIPTNATSTMTTPITTTSSSTMTTTTTTTTRLTPSECDCPEQVPFPSLYPLYSWEAALCGTNVSKSCPSGSNIKNNNAIWFCGFNGKWVGLPDMSNCTTRDWSDFEDELNNPNSTASAGDTLDKLSSNITSSIAPGDIISVVHILDVSKKRHKKDLLNVTRVEEAQNITSKYTDSVTKISSRLLETPAVWDGLPKQSRFETSSQLQENVKEAAVEMAILLVEQRQTYNYSVLTVLVEQFSSAHYDVQENRTFVHSEYKSNHVQLPANFHANQPDDKKVAVTFAAYKTLHCVLGGEATCEDAQNINSSELPINDVTNSPIIGLTVGNSSWSAPSGSKVEVHFKHFFSGDNYTLEKRKCVWWDSNNNSWSEKGCRKKEETNSGTVCLCDHLTNLAVIMDVHGKLPESTKRIARVMTIVGSAISLPCLLLTILTLGRYLWKHKTKTRLWYNIQIHINLCCCLFVSEIILLTGMDQTQTKGGCGFVAGLLHYLLLTTFCWMGVESINVYSLLINVFSRSNTPMKLYYAFAYGCPAIIVAISAGVMMGEGYGSDKYCWLSNERGLAWAFEGPALAILLMNLIVFILSIKTIRDHINREVASGIRGGTDDGKVRKWELSDKKRMVLVSFIIATTLGLSWILGFAFMFEEVEGLAHFFVIVNSLQGFFLFIALIILDQNRRREMLKMLHIHPKTAGTRWFKLWYPHGQRGESVFTSSNVTSPSSTSASNSRDSNNKWAEGVSTVSALSTAPQQDVSQIPMGTEIDPNGIYENDPKRM